MDIFYAIAEPTRRTIIEMLAKKGRLSATDISNKFRISAPAISQHLKVLREADVVRVEKQGQKRMYQLNLEKVYEFERWAHEMTKVWNERFGRLDILLKAEKNKYNK
jgi:DNA-binding transcriptional ArsR family regulator